MAFNKDIGGRLTTYFIQKLNVKVHSTGWLIRGECPDCGSGGKFGVNIEMDRTNCFKCGYRPKPIRLLMKLENLRTYTEVFKYLKTFESVDFIERKAEPLVTKQTHLPEGFKLLSLGDSFTAKLARKYMRKRGYKIMSLTMKGIGYCTKGKFATRIIIPYYKNGQLIYFNAREFINTGLRHMNPDIEEFNVGKSMVTYNSDALYIYKTTYLVESATNALTMGDKAWAIGGKLPSEYQMSDCLRSPCKGIIIILDPDAYWEALKAGMKLVNKKKVKVVKLPKIKSPKDPTKFLDINDLGKQRVMEFVKKTPWQNYQELYKLFINTPKPKHFLPEA
jgi:hypothetical protein